jgi:hypothetical protein
METIERIGYCPKILSKSGMLLLVCALEFSPMMIEEGGVFGMNIYHVTIIDH